MSERVREREREREIWKFPTSIIPMERGECDFDFYTLSIVNALFLWVNHFPVLNSSSIQ